MSVKSKILKFRVTPEEKEIINNKALSSYRLVSCYLRDCALDKQITVINGAEKIADELRRIGNNINQLAAKANTLGFIDAPMLKNEAAKWNKFQSEIERTYLRPNQSEMKWQ